ncbi:MAG: hypothetical protein WAO93_08430 [Orrella sp.]|jgi:hypothetical protein|uniref:hypothetical protein n=1 Tax=Orrella sp. TaxID=1921583 RepID=UPI003BDE45FE
MTLAQRFTTEYADFEDRIRVSHQLDSGEIVVTWLTRRLTDRLVIHLGAWLEKETVQIPRPDVVQSFAQEAAAVELAQAATSYPQAAVKPPPLPVAWLVREIDINTEGEGVRFQLRGESPHEKCQLRLSRFQLRQWLNILRSQYLVAQWPLSAWPQWLQPNEASTVTAQASGRALH